MGQTVLQGNALTGLCVLAALVLCDLKLACAAIIGAIAAHVCAVIAHNDSLAVRDGLHGFNGVLCALAAAVFIDDTQIALGVALLSAMAATCLAAPFSRWLGARNLAVYSSPCLVVTWAWLFIRSSAHDAAHPSAIALTPFYAQAESARFPLDAMFGAAPTLRLPRGLGDVFAAMAQTVFASGIVPGMLVAIGIALASRRAAWHGLAGAVASTAVAWLCAAPLPTLQTGVAGFNGALAALALADEGMAATLVAAMLAAVLQAVVMRAGWPAMSAPFVVAVWCVRLCTRAGERSAPLVH